MRVGVVTLTRWRDPEALERCRASVAASDVPGLEHVVLDGRGDWAAVKADALTQFDLVAMVDDDDAVEPAAIRHCLAAMGHFGVALACTDEQCVDVRGDPVARMQPPKGYGVATCCPTAIHHLSVVRGRSVPASTALALHRRFGLGFDWFVRVGTALTGGAVHVRFPGYRWTVGHPGSLTSLDRAVWIRKLGAMQDAILRSWRVPPGPMFTFTPR